MNLLNGVKKALGLVIDNPTAPPVIQKLPLKSDQYYQAVHKKTHIFLHHTAGGSAASSVGHWAADPKRIATPYIIDRDGTIYECYDPKFWCYHLGVKGGTALEKASIGIEICNYGALKEGKTYTGKIIEPQKRVNLSFRGQTSWEAYTPQQIAALADLIPYLMDRFEIPSQSELVGFWEYRDPFKLPPGIWSHTTVRKDKIDIFPQPELVDMVYHFR